MYGATECGIRSSERWKVTALEMKCVRSFIAVPRMDRFRNEEVRSRAGIEMELASRADQRLLRWFLNVDRMDEYRMVRRVSMDEVIRGRVQGRQRLGWMEGVKVALGNKGMMVEGAQQCIYARIIGKSK